MALDQARLRSIVESLIFVSEQPLSFRKIRNILEGVPTKDLKMVLDEMVAEYSLNHHGVNIELVADGYQMRTKPENQEWVKMLVEYKPVRFSQAALETLAIIAYRQPLTKPELENIRGVDCASSLSKLLELGLIKILGRKEMPGRPFIYGTTPEFLEVFNLSNLEDLPTLQEIEDLSAEDIETFTQSLEQENDNDDEKEKQDITEENAPDEQPESADQETSTDD